MGKNILAITACPAGIAHTYMAAEGLNKASKKIGCNIKVETQGAIGAENILTDEEVKNADFIIIASDVGIDLTRFIGKRVYQAKSIDAIKDAKALIEKASKEAVVYGEKGIKVGKVTLGETDNRFIKHIMSGISYMVPMCIVAGFLLAIVNIFAYQKDDLGRIINSGFDLATPMGYFISKLLIAGQVGFTLMIPLLAGFVANSIGDKPAIAPAMIGAYLANDKTFLGTEAGGGFLSAIIVAFIVGYMVKGLKKIKWPKIIQPLLAIMIIPLIATFTITVIVLFLMGQPIAVLMDSLYTGLTVLTEKYSSVPFIIGAIVGGMIGFDFGGPVNKIALIFGAAVFADTVIKYGIQGANFVPGTAVQAAISVAPLGIWLASIMFKNKFTRDEKISANSAFRMGIVGETEGAIPFVESNPRQMIIASVVGSAFAGGLVGVLGVRFYGGIGSPLGALIGYIEQPIPIITWVGSISVGVLVTALILGFMRKPVIEEIEKSKDEINRRLVMDKNKIEVEHEVEIENEVFRAEHVYIDEESKTQEEAFEFLANVVYENGYVESKEAYLEGLYEREKESTTGFSDGIAIPHCKSSTVIKSGVFLARFKNEIEWDALDGKPVKVAFGLAIPEDGADNHIKILSKIATKIIDDKFRDSIVLEKDTNKLVELVSEIKL